MQIVETSKIPSVDEIQDIVWKDNQINVLKTCMDLQILCEKERGIGLSAVQVGLPWKLFIIKGDGTCPIVEKNQYGFFLNCNYEPINDERIMSLEGCLSIRSDDGRLRSFQVERHKNIKLYGYKLEINNRLIIKEIKEVISANQQGIVFQHEIDHHKGTLISDIGKEVFIW